MNENEDLFAELESEPMPVKDPVRRVMNLYYLIDTSGYTPAVKELDYRPEYPLEKGVKETIAWYKKEGWL